MAIGFGEVVTSHCFAPVARSSRNRRELVATYTASPWTATDDITFWSMRSVFQSDEPSAIDTACAAPFQSPK